MLDRIGRAYRGMATGVCFFIFGVGQLLEAFLLLPLLVLLVRDAEKRRQLGKLVMHYSFKGFVEIMRLVGVLTYDVRNLERLDRPGLLVLANHPSLIDVVFLISFLRRANCIVKSSLYRNPFTRFAMMAADLIPGGSGVEILARCQKSMEEGDTLIIFPEGGRSEPDRLQPFQRAASNIAVRLQRNITPVLIHSGEHNLGRKSVWWRAPKNRMRFEFEVGEDIPIQPFLERESEAPLAVRALTDHLSQYFQRGLERH